MRKILLFAMFLVFHYQVFSQILVHHWNFNNSTSEATLLTPSVANGGSIIHNQGTNSGGFQSAIQITSNTAQGFDVTNPNARNGDVAGTHLRFNNPIGGNLVFALPTTGYKDIIVKYATRRSGSGAHNQVIDYSLDGTSFINFTTLAPVDGNPTLQTLDFSSIAGASDNPNFKVKISFTQGGGGLEGNNRFDNFTLEGNPIVYLNKLLYYWSFNNASSEATLLTPNVSLISGSSITHVAGGTSAIDFAGGTGQNFNIDNHNARNGEASGTHLRFNNPIGGRLVFALPTTNSKDVIVKFSTRRSSSGAGTQVIEYTTDGTNYTFLKNITVTEIPTLETLDFTSLTAVNNNPNFKIRIGFALGAGGAVGNNRFDNLSVDANTLINDSSAPTVLFSPLNNASGITNTIQPSLTFNEDIRLIDNSALTNSNVDNLIELRLNNSAGTTVPFDATVNNKVITIVPASALLNSQQYYVALKAGMVEDLSDNGISTVQSSVFTTIAVQTVFASGDIVPVAYRMNATATEDEIALLTTVVILPGTVINLTDSKYTTNAQAQCPNVITWTAPSAGVAPGTVIRIQTSALVANIGTVVGSSFGLSSGGDQVIVYTGTASNPSYITALSSNAWVSVNAECGGSFSMRPAGLTDGTSSISLSTAPGNVSANTVNAYYDGTQVGTMAALKTAILDPANWKGADSGTPPQVFPTFAFPGPPAVVSKKVINQSTLEIVFNSDLDPVSSISLTNFTGITGLGSITRTNNGSKADTLILNYTTPFIAGTAYTLTINGVKDVQNLAMFSPATFSFTYNTTIGFKDKFISVNESAGSIVVPLILANPSASSVKVVLKAAPFSTASASDITYTGTEFTFTGSSNSTHNITIPIVNDTESEMDEYFVLSLEDLSGVTLTGKQYITIYIKDNDRQAPVPQQDLNLNYISSFKPNTVAGSTTEIVVHDPITQRLFMTSAIQDRLDIADFSNPAAITLIKSIDMTPYGGITSVAVRDGVVAVASPNANEQLDGQVVFFNTNGDFQKKVTVGALPDMITFSPDGKKILTANEGQPNSAYSVDPEGSVSIIDISGGLASVDQSKVSTLLFTSFNAQEAALRTAGVRKTKATSTLSQDFEPEYVSVSADSKKAWVTLQENNAIAEINLETNSYTSVWPLGKKDFSVSGVGFDASDNSGVIHISNYPVKSFYMPDAVSSFSINNKNYLVTANEGDEKEYSTLNERTTVGAATTVLDLTIFPNAAVLKEEHNIGRLRISNLQGDTDNDGDYDELVMVGARSFSIWDADSKTLVYDSKDDIERYIASDPAVSALFNADNESNAFKNRSRAKGPEPEGVTVASINGATYAFVTLERVGGVIVYNITDPTQVKLVDYKNNRTSSGGDLGPEGIIYIPATQSPDGKAYIAIANEISGNISIFQIIATPVVSASGILSFCPGQSVVLTSTDALAYQWFRNGTLLNGETNRELIATLTGDYTVQTTFANGIKKTSEATSVNADDTIKPEVRIKNISVALVNGSAVITAADVDNGTTDNCGIASLGLNKTSFGCNDIGDQTVTLTATDKSGNTSSATATVTVTGSIPAPSIAVSRTDNTFTGLDPKTIALGYGAQALTLTASNNASATNTYSWSPAAGLSNAATADPVFKPTSAGSYTFTVNVTNESGCQASTSVTIKVIDVRCGNKNDKVLICKKQGKKANEICVSANAVASHLSNGDKLGSCTSSGVISADGNERGALDISSLEVPNSVSLTSYPNPFANQTTVSFSVPQSELKVTLAIFDAVGNRIATLYSGKAEANVRNEFVFDSSQLPAGAYFARLITSKGSQTFKLIVAK
ncbi:MAG: choice-of-anchor I family protein [Pyrinomonadaceae bacterium]|nr:choice-of-anchor I family protein [Sphingobacteriaceae bacterium]